MQRICCAVLTLALGALVLHDVANSHGGTYRGPGDTVPPGGGGGGGGQGSGAPGPAGPTSGPAGPSSPASTGAPGSVSTGRPATPSRSASATGGFELGVDLTGWTYWWEFNKDRYLHVKDAIYANTVQTGSLDFFQGRTSGGDNVVDLLMPSPADIRQKIVPALLAALEHETSNDIVTGCLIALAKIGDTIQEDGETRLGQAMLPFLSDSSQEIRETAALALGILGDSSAIEVLSALAEDSVAGRKLVQDTEVDYRTRSFAAFGLGLVGSRLQEDDDEDRTHVLATLIGLLETDRSSTRDIQVACLSALGLTPAPDGVEIDGGEPGASFATREGQIDYLLAYFQDESRATLSRAHAPTAIVRLFVDLTPERRELLKQRVTPPLLAVLRSRVKSKAEIEQSCALALGALGDADADELDVEIRTALIEAEERLHDVQARFFAQLGLAQAGARAGSGESPRAASADVRKLLLRRLARGGSMARPWTGLALGVFGAAVDEERTPLGDVRKALRDKLEEEGMPERVGAYAVALGMLRDVDARELLLDKLERVSSEESRGYVALALGMVGDRSAIDDIQRLVEESKYKPELLRQAATALGLLGDRQSVPGLVQMLERARSLSTQAALAAALGTIGDKRSIDPLVAMLAREDLTDSARGFAAVALGIVGDTDALPWSSKLAIDVNYRAATPTLNDVGGTGVLNIL